MKSFRKFGKLGNLFKSFFSSNKDLATITILDENEVALANVAVQIKRGFYTYVGVTDADGKVEVRGTFMKKYEVTLAKSGVEQIVVDNWEFDAISSITYPQDTKVTWDGMYSNTDARMYVDIHDGGNSGS